jgi:hypothetical protein
MKTIKIIFTLFLSINALMQGYFGGILMLNTTGAIETFNPEIKKVAGVLLQNSVLLGSTLLFSSILLVISNIRQRSNE